MKIRTDFVTNSSSSSFSVIVAIQDKSGKRYSFSWAPEDYEQEDGYPGGTSSFEADLKSIFVSDPKPRLSIDNVKAVAEFLMDAVQDDVCASVWDGDEVKRWVRTVDKKRKNRKSAFVAEVSTGIASVADIARISVDREYYAWGEFADLVADNDEKLNELAEVVRNASPDKKRQAMDAMLAYIRTSDPSRFCESFGEGYEDFRYRWDGNDEDLLKLVDRLGSGYGPDYCSGREHNAIDLVTGEVESYAEFDLTFEEPYLEPEPAAVETENKEVGSGQTEDFFVYDEGTDQKAEIIALYEDEDMSAQEIADELGIDVEIVIDVLEEYDGV